MKLSDTLERVRAMMDVDTLETRGRDALDFHSLSVQSIRSIVEYAYLCGQQAGIAECRGLVAGKVDRPAKVNVRNPDASRNELATALAAVNAEDVVDPRSASPEPRRAVGFVEVKPGEEPERFDADWDGGTR